MLSTDDDEDNSTRLLAEREFQRTTTDTNFDSVSKSSRHVEPFIRVIPISQLNKESMRRKR